MANIETIDLTAYGVQLPSDQIGIVIAQPYLSLSPEEPYQCTTEAKPRQLEMIRQTLSIARSAAHGALKTHFTIFPEYTLPGLEGIQEVENALHSDAWPPGTVVIGGSDALRKTQYVELLGHANTHIDDALNGGDRVHDNQWVNCAITWIKGEDGTVMSWVQPKLCPAWPELKVTHQQMFCGNSLFAFKGRLTNQVPFRFSTLICFDWIAANANPTPCDSLLEHIHQSTSDGQLPLTWLFVIQCNPKPSHNTFLSRVREFFDQNRFPNALRNNACLVFANTAGMETPGPTDQFGGCSVVHSPQAQFQSECSQPTFSNGGKGFRDGSDLLSRYNDTYFRERGACIHSFCLVNPASLVVGPAGRSFAVRNAYVYSVTGTAEPRAPSHVVPASVKWLNDQLDVIPSLSFSYATAPLATEADEAHWSNLAALRGIPSQSVTHTIALATASSSGDLADRWSQIESDALKHLVHTLDVFAVGFAPPSFVSGSDHATVSIDDRPVDVLAIRGASHEACLQHYKKKFIPNPRRQAILTSRDLDNSLWPRKFGSILHPTKSRLGEEPNITDPGGNLLHLGYQNLLSVYLEAQDSVAIKGGIDAQLAE
ncbi:MAG: hypothetical protein WA634_16925 [Silvibacterium sp.]